MLCHCQCLNQAITQSLQSLDNVLSESQANNSEPVFSEWGKGCFEQEEMEKSSAGHLTITNLISKQASVPVTMSTVTARSLCQ